MSLNSFQPRVMRAALEQLKPPRQFFKPMFFKTDEEQLTEHCDVDVVDETRRMAPFVSEHGAGKFVEREGFTTSTVTPPRVAPKMTVTTPDVQTRLPGEHIYEGRSPDEREAALVRQTLQTLDNTIVRREEWMCARALFDSEIDISGDDITQTITYPRDSSLVLGLLGSSDRWDAATSDIPKQIRAWRRLILKKTGLSSDIMVVSEEAADALLANQLLLGSSTKGGQLNTLNLNMGQISPQLLESGATFYGMFAGTNVQIWGHDEWFIDPTDGSEDPMVPSKRILLGCSQARTAMRYGAVRVKTGENTTAMVANRRVIETWVDREPAVRVVKMTSRPIPVPIQNNAFLTAQVIS
jgi:hypothetical protein